MNKLTGNTRYRTNWEGRLILQVEVGVYQSDKAAWVGSWRDASVKDLIGTVKGDPF